VEQILILSRKLLEYVIFNGINIVRWDRAGWISYLLLCLVEQKTTEFHLPKSSISQAPEGKARIYKIQICNKGIFVYYTSSL